MWTDDGTKGSKSNIKTPIKEWKAQQVEPAPKYVLSLKTHHKKMREKNQNSYFWRMTYDGMGNKLERTMNGREI